MVSFEELFFRVSVSVLYCSLLVAYPMELTCEVPERTLDVSEESVVDRVISSKFVFEMLWV